MQTHSEDIAKILSNLMVLNEELETYKKQIINKDEEIERLKRTLQGSSSTSQSPPASTTSHSAISVNSLPLYVMYSSAWTEIAARLQIRHNCMNAFATIAIAFVGVISGAILREFLSYLPGEVTKEPAARQTAIQALSAIGLVMPVLGIIFAYWISQQDYVICLLQRFMGIIESDTNTPLSLRWHTRDERNGKQFHWSAAQIRYRRYVHYPFLGLLALTSFPSVFLAVLQLQQISIAAFLLITSFMFFGIRLSNCIHLGKHFSGIGNLAGIGCLTCFIVSLWVLNITPSEFIAHTKTHFVSLAWAVASVSLSCVSITIYVGMKNYRESVLTVVDLPLIRDHYTLTSIIDRSGSYVGKAWNYLTGAAAIDKTLQSHLPVPMSTTPTNTEQGSVMSGNDSSSANRNP
jgi:hypothetical protein